MSVKVSMKGSGEIGEITPGWSVQEYATPLTIGEYAGGTGQVSISAKAKAESAFIINNNATTSCDNFSNNSIVSGVINSVSLSGMNASFSHGNVLTKFDAEYSIPPLGAGGVEPAINLINQLSGNSVGLRLGSGYYYSLAGHSVGFDANGRQVVPFEWSGKYSDNFILKDYINQTGTIFADSWVSQDGHVWAQNVVGDSFSEDYSKPSSRVYFKAKLNGDRIIWGATVGNPNGGNNNEGAQSIGVEIDYASERLSASYLAIIGGSEDYDYNEVSLSALNLDEEIAVFIEYLKPISNSGNHVLSVSVVNTSDYANVVSCAVNYDSFKNFNNSWTIRAVTNQVFLDPEDVVIPSESLIRAIYRADDAGLPSGSPVTVDTNYIINPSFELNLNNWEAFGNTVTGFTQASTAYAGTKSAKLSRIDEFNSWDGIKQRIDFPIAIEGQINFSAYIKAQAGSATGQIWVEQYDANDVLIYSTRDDPYSYSDYANVDASTWTRINVIFGQYPSAAYALLKIGTRYYTTDLLIDAVALTAGGQPRTYFDGDTADSGVYTYSYASNGESIEQVSASALNREYENSSTYAVTNVTKIGGPVPATRTNAWQYIQDACSAFGDEISIINDTIVIHDAGQNIVNIENTIGIPSMSVSTSFSGRSVEVVYSNAVNAVNKEFYNARADDNRIIAVKYGETITTTVAIEGTPVIVNQPTYSLTAVSGVGQYRIISSSTSTSPIISEQQWKDYGGNLIIKISDTAENSIDIILVGPSIEIPGHTGPYKLAYTSGNDYAALSVTGSGVLTDVKKLKLYTGADPEKVTQEVAKTITNQFVDTLERAYDRGIFASMNAAGPKVTLSLSVPTSAITALGVTPGSTVKYLDSIYRVSDLTIGNLATSLNIARHVSVNDFDEVWNNQIVGTFDTLWDGYDTSDNVIKPLWFIGDDEGVVMMLDTDVNPYYDVAGDPTISVFPDADANPFYLDGGNIEGEDPVYLDVDNNPYDGGEGFGS